MEIKDILSWIVPIGLMFLMMRFGGCCGGHGQNRGQAGQAGGGCCGGGAKDAGPAKDGVDSTSPKDAPKKSCH